MADTGFYQFDRYRIDMNERLLLCEGETVPLAQKSFDVLLALVERNGQIVDKEELMQRVWPDAFVEEGNLTQHIYKLRKILGQSPGGRDYIENIPRRGYRFVARITESAALLSSSDSREKPIDSLAILPFRNTDTESEYLSDGLANNITYSLSQLPGLKMMSRSAVYRYKGRDVEPQTVGRELGVRAVVTGRVVRRKDDLLVSVELVDASDNSLLWGQQYERRLADALAVEREISREISEKLKLKLSGEETRRLNNHQTKSSQAYNLYLQGRYHVERMTSYSLLKGAALFEQALEADPDYALAHIGLASAWILGSDWVFAPREVMPRTEAAAMRLLEMDPSLAEAHAALAYVRAFYDWNWAEAEREYRRAIELNPDQAPIEYARFLAAMGRFDEAIAEIRRAEQLDPVSPRIKTWVGRILFAARHYEEAERQLRASSELDPHHVCAPILISEPLISQAKYTEAIASVQKFISMDRSIDNLGYLGFAYAKAGNRDEALGTLDEIKQLSAKDYVSPFYIALIYVGLGERDQAFEWFDRAFEDRASQIIELKTDPKLDSLRSDPRLSRLIARVGL